MSPLADWLADPAGERALRAVVGTRPDGGPGGILSSDELVAQLGSVPLSTLVPYGLLSQEQVKALVNAVTGPPS